MTPGRLIETAPRRRWRPQCQSSCARPPRRPHSTKGHWDCKRPGRDPAAAPARLARSRRSRSDANCEAQIGLPVQFVWPPCFYLFRRETLSRLPREQILLNEIINVAIEHRINIATLELGPRIFYQAIGGQDIVANLRAEADVLLVCL